MPIFTRLLDFRRDFLARLRDKRSHPRHPVGAEFPLKAALSLVGSEQPGPDRTPVRGRGLSWSGQVENISANGLSIFLSPAAATVRGEPTLLQLTLEDQEVVIPCTVAHFRVHGRHALCGVRLEFDDFKVQKSYHQLVEAVRIGASFAPAGPGRTQPGFALRSWRSAGRTLLTEWREPASRALARFELILGEHAVHGRSFPPGLEVQPRTGGANTVPPDLADEVLRLYRWVVGNLPKNVPADLREFMSRVGRNPPPPPDRGAWQAPVTARAFTSTVIKVPLSTWRAPKPALGADSIA